MRFGSKAAVAVGFTLASGLSALAADLPLKAASPAPYNWTGFYAGVNAGYGWATGNGISSFNGVIGGAQAGFNWQTGNFVWGVETDIQATGQKSTTTVAGAVTISETDKLTWLGTTRLRAGWAADRWFFYGTGGLAYAKLKEDGTATGALTGTYSGSNTKTGWTVGAGVEAAIAQNWSWKLEYLYASFGAFTNTYALTGGTLTINYPQANENIVRAGLNYRF